jgi:hypothetical protein
MSSAPSSGVVQATPSSRGTFQAVGVAPSATPAPLMPRKPVQSTPGPGSGRRAPHRDGPIGQHKLSGLLVSPKTSLGLRIYNRTHFTALSRWVPAVITDVNIWDSRTYWGRGSRAARCRTLALAPSATAESETGSSSVMRQLERGGSQMKARSSDQLSKHRTAMVCRPGESGCRTEVRE